MSKQNKTGRTKPNYVVSWNGATGVKVVDCRTVKDVWAAIESADNITTVYSPTGRDVSRFAPK